MAFRRVFFVLPAASAILIALAVPAVAAPVGCATAAPKGTTTVQVCVDQNGNNRGTYVQATAAPQAVVLQIHSIWLNQCNNGGNPTSCSVVARGPSYTVTGTVLVTTTWGSYPFSFGHTYQGCASVTVSGQFYGGVCSTIVPN